MARALGVSPTLIHLWRKRNYFPLSRLPKIAAELRLAPDALAHLATPDYSTPVLVPKSALPVIARRYRAGETLELIAKTYGVSRERIRQLLKPLGLNRMNGGNSIRAAKMVANVRAAREAAFFERHGCTREQFRAVCGNGYTRRDDYYRTPHGAYISQRNNAKNRGIAWNFKFWGWWQVWELSGKWAERGRGHGYCMARIGDTGPYSPDNVHIVTGPNNVAEYYERERATHGRVRRGEQRKAA